MNTEDRRIIKEIKRHRDLEANLPAYGNAYINSAYEYSLIRLVLNYYTMKEVFDEGGSVISDEPLNETIEQVHTIIYESLMKMDDAASIDYDDLIKRLDALRGELTDRMVVLTAYTDALQIYEYVLNRIEYGITGATYDVNVDSLSERLFKYIFNDNDKMVINSKVQMVTAQLPIRMTKSKFYDYLNDTLNIYNGSDVSSVDSFTDMMKSTAVLEKPEGYGKLYPEVYRLIEQLDNTDYKKLSLETYQAIMEQFSFTTVHLTDTVSNHLLLMEIVNALYSVLLAMPYESNDNASVAACTSMIAKLHDAYIARSEIPSSVDEGFELIEGVQEQLGEDILSFEAVLPDVLEDAEDDISWIMADELFKRLEMISKLMANSLFVDLKDSVEDSKTAGPEYIAGKRDELVEAFGKFFESHPKEVNRAVMGAVFSNMPVLFNSISEIKDYIEHSLSHCSNESELMACAKLLDEMMAEE
ncbi:MAG: hypothetical protein IJ661_06765 [Lachnospiraceae bacterium]|nr:hypothetical protein [Lachnospiraceae bacterium]